MFPRQLNMAETPVPITTGSGSASIAGDLVSGATYQQIKLVDGTIGGNTPLQVNADGSISASVYGAINVTITSIATASGVLNVNMPPFANQSVSGTVGASIIGLVPVFATPNGTFPVVVTGSVLTQFAPTASLISGVTSIITGTASVQVLAPAAGGQRNYITNILVTNNAAVGTIVNFYDGGNVIYAGVAAASGGGFSASFPTPLKQSSIAGNLSALSSVQASVLVSASGYTAA